MTNRIYLDNNATMPMPSQVKEAIVEALDYCGNPSSIHQDGRQARNLLEETRQLVADYFHTKPSQVIFTSGATESNNLLLKSFEGTIITSAIEHDSILSALPHSSDETKICGVDSCGYLNLDHLEDLLKKAKGPVLLSIMAANNETGVIQDLTKIVHLARRYGAFIHSDAVQAIGKIPMDWKELALNAISFSAHKFGGPKGVGALIIDDAISITPLIRGGGQERSYRAGTENFLGITGLGAALKLSKLYDWHKIEQLRDNLENQLINCHPEIAIFGRSYEENTKTGQKRRLPNTSNIQMPGVKGSTQVISFDLKGISVSSGSACSSGKVKVSQVLMAMGIKEPTLQESLRVSLGLETKKEDIDTFLQAWEELYDKNNPLSGE